ncbi:MAG: serine/threonine protein kinase, partial [Proteobacteria bacterium]|nr:serine/threonine protein kinase [Pseudomonadota bacterium]
MNDQSSPMVLQAGYELHWYRVESVLGKGAFGITYLAHDVNLDRQVAIKEYLPGQFSIRNTDLTVHPTTDAHKEDFEWGLKRFISEAKILTKFEHPNLVRVFNVFEMNNTAYMVMNYEVGKSLQQILKSRKTLNESELMKIIIPLLDGLEVMHEKGFVHRDIKPGNIFIRRDGSPVLLDFGSARQTRAERGKEMTAEPQTVTTLVSPGYAPIEQYSSNSNRQGPWTDIYGLGATLYKTVTGKMPLAAVDRSETIVHDNKDCYQPVSNLGEGRYTEKFLAAIDHAMAFKADERPQDVVEWRTEFGIQGDDIPTMPVSNFQAISGSVATFKLDQTQDAVTIKIASGLEEETEKIDSAAFTGVPKPIYLQTKWLASVAIVVIFIAFGIIKLSGEKEDEITPLVQALAESEQVVVEEASEIEEPAALTSEEQTKIEELLILAEEDITALRLTSPSENNALNKYLSILMIDENNIKANEGIRLVSDKYISLAYGAIQSNNLAKADKYIEKAKRIYSESDKVAPARS